jgi:hypothetical protein
LKGRKSELFWKMAFFWVEKLHYFIFTWGISELFL